MYRRACHKAYARRAEGFGRMTLEQLATEYGIHNGDDLYEWWLTHGADIRGSGRIAGQMQLLEEVEEGAREDMGATISGEAVWDTDEQVG